MDRRALSEPEVLVVDDLPDVANSYAEVLRLLGCRASTANDGYSALRLIASGAPDVVLVDLAMPGLNGVELARCVREQLGPRPRLVALTALPSGSSYDARHFDCVVTKPADPISLMGKIRDLTTAG